VSIPTSNVSEAVNVAGTVRSTVPLATSSPLIQNVSSAGAARCGVVRISITIWTSPTGSRPTTERTSDFLRFVVEETLAARVHRLKGYTIAIEVFGRAKNFDANLDPIVRIQTGRLRRALEHYYLVAGWRDLIRIDIPKGGYVPTFTPQRGGRTRASDPQAPDTEEGALQSGPTIAIIPFTNVTGDHEQLFFVNGLIEELTTELNRYEDVISIPCRDVAPTDAAANRLET